MTASAASLFSPAIVSTASPVCLLQPHGSLFLWTGQPGKSLHCGWTLRGSAELQAFVILVHMKVYDLLQKKT